MAVRKSQLSIREGGDRLEVASTSEFVLRFPMQYSSGNPFEDYATNVDDGERYKSN